MNPPAVVTFDFWSTVAIPEIPGTRRARHAAIQQVLGRHGLTVEPSFIEQVFDVTVDAFNEAWAENRQFTAQDGAIHTARQLIDDLFGVHGEAFRNDFDRVKSIRDELINAFLEASRLVQIQLAPGVEGALRDLKSLGVPLAIICDVGLTPSTILREYLESNGVLELFDHLTFSDEVGVYKPAAQMFADALDGLGGVHPSRAAHVGDLLRTDIVGARRHGMRTIRYSGVFDDAVSLDAVAGLDADNVVNDHRHLLEVLGFV